MDFAFEAVGRAGTHCRTMHGHAQNWGVATVVGMIPKHPPIQLDGADLFFAEKTLQGSFMGSNQFPSDIIHFVAMYRSGILNLDNMIIPAHRGEDRAGLVGRPSTTARHHRKTWPCWARCILTTTVH